MVFKVYRALFLSFKIFLMVAMCQSSAFFSVVDLDWRVNHVKSLISCLQKYIFFLLFYLGRLQPAIHPPALPPAQPFGCPPVYMGHSDKTAHLLMSLLIEMNNWCLRFACCTSSANRMAFGASQFTGRIKVLSVSTGSSVLWPLLHTARLNYE
jgi:hypothetical protein